MRNPGRDREWEGERYGFGEDGDADDAGGGGGHGAVVLQGGAGERCRWDKVRQVPGARMRAGLHMLRQWTPLSVSHHPITARSRSRSTPER